MIICAATARAEDVELDDLLEDVPFWEQFYTLRAGLGYSDNILFSDLNRKSSAMLVSGFDATITRLPLDGTEINFFVSIDDRRYFDGGTITNFSSGNVGSNRVDDVRGERTILGLVQAKHDLSANWQVGMSGRYFYQDQVIDLSVTEANLSTLPVTGHQFFANAEALHRFWDNKRIQGELDWTRQIFEEPEVDDYSEYGPKATFGIDLPRRSAIELSYQLERRDYDTRLEYASDGTPVDATRLRYLIHGMELEWKHHFDDERRWRLLARTGIARNDDSGSGYFNYDRFLGSLQLRFRDKRWELEARGRLSWYQYEKQLSDENPGERRERLLTEASLRAGRRLGKTTRAFVEYTFEQAHSNLSYDNYTVNVVSTGVAWEF